MATGTGNLPHQNMSFSPFAILLAEEMNDIVENIESLADGSGIGDDAIIPLATIWKYYGTKATFNTDPARFGWLFVEKNEEYSKTTYARLYNHLVAVDPASVADGASGKFVFEDKWFGRVSVGLDPDDNDFDTLGKSGGHKDLQEHSHGTVLSTGSSTSSSLIRFPWANGSTAAGGASPTTGYQNASSSNSGVRTSGTGDSGNLQPYNTTNLIIKT